MTNRGPILPDISLHWNTGPLAVGMFVRCINEHSQLYRLTGTIVGGNHDGRILTVEIAERGGGVTNYAIERNHLAPIKSS